MTNGDAINKVAWINFASDEDLMYLNRDGEYKTYTFSILRYQLRIKFFLESRVNLQTPFCNRNRKEKLH